MELKNEITKFNLRENGEVDKDDKNGKISEAFKPIAYSGGYPFSISGDIRSVPS